MIETTETTVLFHAVPNTSLPFPDTIVHTL